MGTGGEGSGGGAYAPATDYKLYLVTPGRGHFVKS